MQPEPPEPGLSFGRFAEEKALTEVRRLDRSAWTEDGRVLLAGPPEPAEEWAVLTRATAEEIEVCGELAFGGLLVVRVRDAGGTSYWLAAPRTVGRLTGTTFAC